MVAGLGAWRATQTIYRFDPAFAATLPESLAEVLARDLQPILSLVLYLCSAEADIGPGQRLRPQPIRTKKGWKLFPPDMPVVVEVGYKIGQAIREYTLSEDTRQGGERLRDAIAVFRGQADAVVWGSRPPPKK